jgi:CRISPR/Cas system-associated exonuclease Cas4 (RecB family)
MAFSRNSRQFGSSSGGPVKLSRSKIDLFLECPRCFYLDQRLGIKRPQFPAFTLNSAVDHLLKKEFDIHRAKGEPHPLMKKYGVLAVPFKHRDLEKWRHNFTGVAHLDEPTGFHVFGAIDDLWESERGELHVVDYKATAKDSDPNLEGRWQQGYKRQLEVYQWLLRQNGFRVSPVGYFVYVNGRRDRAAFDARLEFNVHLISYTGDDSWIEPTLQKIKACLFGELPRPASECEYCAYRKAAAEAATREIKDGERKDERKAESNKGETATLF